MGVVPGATGGRVQTPRGGMSRDLGALKAVLKAHRGLTLVVMCRVQIGKLDKRFTDVILNIVYYI